MDLHAGQLRARAHFGKSKAAVKEQRKNNRVRVVHCQNAIGVFGNGAVVYKRPNRITQKIEDMPQHQVMEELEFELRRRESLNAIQKERQDTRTTDTDFCIKNKITHIYTPNIQNIDLFLSNTLTSLD